MLLAALAMTAALVGADDLSSCLDSVADDPPELARYRCLSTLDAAREDDAVLDAVRHAVQERAGNPWLRYTLATLLQRRGAPEAGAMFRRVAEEMAGAGARGDAARVEAALAGIALSRGNADAVREHAARARALATDPPDRKAALAVDVLDAAIAVELDQKLRRGRLLATAVLEDPDAGPEVRMNALNVLAAVATRSDRPQEAAAHLWRMAGVAHERGALEEEARSRVLALVLARTRHAGQNAVAPTSELDDALALAQSLDRPQLELLARGELLRAVGAADADAHREACRLLAGGTSYVEGRQRCEEGWAYARLRDDPHEAEAIAYRSLAESTDAGASWRALHARLLLTRIAWATAPRDVAIEASIDLLLDVEELRRTQPQREERFESSAPWSPAYATAVDGFLEAGEVDLALTAAEHLRDSERGWSEAAATVERLRSRGPGVDTALAVWARGVGRTWVIVVDADGAQACPLAPMKELESAVAVFSGLSERGAVLDGTDTELYQRVIGCAGERLERSRTWVLLPQEALHRTPIAALRAAADEVPTGVRHALMRTATIDAWLRSSPLRPTAGAVAIGDPIAAPMLDGGPGPSLPHARMEASIAARDGRVLVGAAATEAGFRELAASAPAVLHIATHAVQLDAESRAAALSLTPAGEDDGLLRPDEVAGVDLSGTVVVLSACSSGADRLVTGHGLAGLSAAFLDAGATAVVANLWPLRDDDALAFFDAFYDHLRAGESVAAAVTSARAERLSAGASAPAWAGFVVLGRGDATVALPRRSPPPPLGPGWLVLTAGLVTLLRWEKRRRTHLRGFSTS